MKHRLCRLLLLLASLSADFSAAEKAQRIVSLSVCTDQILLMLVDKERIAGITYLAADPVYSYMWPRSADIVTHTGLIEEVVPLKPDLIISSKYATGNILQMLRYLGHQPQTFESPTTLAEVESFTRAIGAAVGESERAEQVIDHMHRDIARAKAMVAHLPEEVAISYGPNGFTAGEKTLKNEVLNAVGYSNLGAQLGIEYYGNISLEQLIWSNPDAVIIDEAIPNQDSLAQNSINHPVLKRLFSDRALPSLPTSYWICPGPVVSKAILALAELRL